MSDVAQAIQDLKNTMKGGVVTPDNSNYAELSHTFMGHGSPAAILRPISTEEVTKIITVIRKYDVPFAVRCGGHSNAGHGTSDGLVIDLRRMNSVEIVDEAQHTVRIEGGAIWMDIAAKLQPHGLAISSGDTKTVGVGGLALGGGIGWMVRKYGLVVDNIVAAEVVTAEGKVVHADAKTNSDLFWAIRGGGGNFGIVTSFDITAHEIGEVYGGMIMYDLKDLRQALTGWRDYMRTAPEELTTMFIIVHPNPAFPGFSGAMITLCYAGDDETAANKAIEPLTKFGKPLQKNIKRQDYASILEDAHMPGGIKVLAYNAFVKELSDELIGVICETDDRIFQIRSVGGAMNRIAPDATAFAHRDKEALVVSPTFVAPDASAKAIDDALASWRKIEKFSSGAYVNLFSEDEKEIVDAAYPTETYARLAKIKQQYDPENIFSKNYNIKPAR